MKILHIFNVAKGSYFAKLLIECINSSGCFNSSNHYFCIRNATLKEQFYKFDNVFYDDSNGSIAYKYVNDYDYIFMHGLSFSSELSVLPKQYLHKIIWRTWGGSSGLYSIPRKNLFLYYFDIFKKRRTLNILKRMPFVCGANVIDRIDTKQKKNHFYEFPYPISPSSTLSIADTAKSNGDTVNILVGHSAYKTDKHDAVLNRLIAIKEYDIKIFVPLTYGVDEYKEKIISKWSKVFKNKIVFLTEQLDVKNYCLLISQTDLFFLVGDRSYALGNIEIALRNNVNLVLSKKGVIRKGFKKDKIKHFVFEKINFSNGVLQFKKKLNKNLATTIISNYETDIMKLKKIFNILESKEN